MTIIRAREIGGAWLVLEAALGTAPTPLAAVAQNRFLGGFAKLALAADGTWQARAELPLDVGVVHERRRADTAAALAAVLGERVLALGAAEPALAASLPTVDPDDVALRAAATGWPCTRLRDARVAVDLGIPGLARGRVAANPAAGHVRAWAELDRLRWPLPPRCERAVSLLLLRAAAAVRLVRPVLETFAAHAAIVFEVVYAHPLPEPDELTHAFAALRVAAETTSREVRVLARDPAVAAAYLRANDDCIPDDIHPAGPRGSATTAGAMPAAEGGLR